MPLYREVDDFDALLAAAGEQRRLPAGVVEKDYWITQALRGMQERYPGAFIFKGGTSLSKAYRLIDRFSEDLDILLLSDGLKKSARQKLMKRICTAAADQIGAAHEKQAGGQSYRRVELSLDERSQPGPPGLPFILLDVGFSGGVKPQGDRTIGTLVGELLEESGQARQADYDDLRPFDVPVLAPWRTLVEKLILVNSVADACETDLGQVASRRAGRHFYDVHMLLGSDDVRDALANREAFDEVVADALRITEEHFGTTFQRPEGGFAEGLAFTCDGELRNAFEADYASIMDTFYFGAPPYPTYASAIERVREHAHLL